MINRCRSIAFTSSGLLRKNRVHLSKSHLLVAIPHFLFQALGYGFSIRYCLIPSRYFSAYAYCDFSNLQVCNTVFLTAPLLFLFPISSDNQIASCLNSSLYFVIFQTPFFSFYHLYFISILGVCRLYFYCTTSLVKIHQIISKPLSRLRRQLLAAARSRFGSERPPDCHSLPRRHCATLQGRPRSKSYKITTHQSGGYSFISTKIPLAERAKPLFQGCRRCSDICHKAPADVHPYRYNPIDFLSLRNPQRFRQAVPLFFQY